MSTTIINLSVYVDGLLTDLTSAVFANAAATFGIRRIDTGASVVALNTALTHLATGTYQHSFTDPASGLSYEYALKIVYLGTTYYYTRIIQAGTVSNLLTIPTSNHYSSQAEVVRYLGDAAIQLMTEDWTSDDTSPLWQDILEEVDETIDLYTTQRYPRHYFSNRFLRRKATILAIHSFSSRRGNPSLFIARANQVYSELDEIRSGRLHLPNSIPIGWTGPVVRNYVMQPLASHPMRVETTKSTGDQYSRMDFAFEPYLLVT